MKFKQSLAIILSASMVFSIPDKAIYALENGLNENIGKNSSNNSANKDETSDDSNNKDKTSNDSNDKDKTSDDSNNKDETSDNSTNKDETSNDSSNKDEISNDSSNKNETSNESSNKDETSDVSSNKDETSNDSINKDESSDDNSNKDELSDDSTNKDETSNDSINKDEPIENENLILSWQYIEYDEKFLERVGEKFDTYYLALEGTCISLNQALELLPKEIEIKTSKGVENLNLDWKCDNFSQEEVYNGEYTFYANLPQEYKFSEETQTLSIKMIFEQNLTMLAMETRAIPMVEIEDYGDYCDV